MLQTPLYNQVSDKEATFVHCLKLQAYENNVHSMSDAQKTENCNMQFSGHHYYISCKIQDCIQQSSTVRK